MVIIDLMTDKTLPAMVWNKLNPVAEVVQIELWKREGYSSDHIASAYGMTRQGLNKKIKAIKEKAALRKQDGEQTEQPDEDTHGSQSASCYPSTTTKHKDR